MYYVHCIYELKPNSLWREPANIQSEITNNVTSGIVLGFNPIVKDGRINLHVTQQTVRGHTRAKDRP